MSPPTPVRFPTRNTGEFPPHGTARVSVTGRIVRLYAVGPWNAEFVVQAHKSIRAQVAEHVEGPWALLVDMKGTALCGPDALAAIRNVAGADAKQAGRIATAWVIEPGVEGRNEMSRFAQSTFAGVTPIRVYRNEAEAEEWLTAMLALARGDAPGNEQPSLFARAGGSVGIRGLVDAFYARVREDPALAPFFDGVAMDRLRCMQSELFSVALGGPTQYTGRPLVEAHQHLHIGLREYQRFVRHLFDTLEELHLTDQERYEIVGRLNLLTDDVVGATGLVG